MVKLSTFYKDLIGKFIKLAGVEPDTIDITAEWDSSLSYGENKNQIAKKFNLTPAIREKTITKKEVVEEADRIQIENLHREEEHYRQIQEEAIRQIKDSKSTPYLDNAFYVPKELVRTLAKSKNIHGLILQGEAGIGKSHLVLQTLSEDKLKMVDESNEGDFNILTGYATPLELYMFLYANRENRILVFDDIMKLFENELSKGILLSALWNPSGKRIVNYFSTTEKLTVPKTFEFNSKIIWCVNQLPTELQNIKSRCYFFEMAFNYKEKLNIMYEIAKIRGIPFEIIDFIKDNTNEAYENIDFRLPTKIFDIYKNHATNWKTLGTSLLKPDEDLQMVRELLSKSITVNEAVLEFITETGKSRATFFRYKKELIEHIKISKSQGISIEVKGEKEIKGVSTHGGVAKQG